MHLARKKSHRSLRNRTRARGAVVRTNRRRLCAEFIGNCRPKRQGMQRSCTWLGTLSEDPIGFGDGPNVYSYVGNDPVNFRDPTGNAEAGNPFNTLSISTPNQGFNGPSINELIFGGLASTPSLISFDTSPSSSLINSNISTLDSLSSFGQTFGNDLFAGQRPLGLGEISPGVIVADPREIQRAQNRTNGAADRFLAETVASVVILGAGETLDGLVIADQTASGFEKSIAATSLAIGVATVGISPNAGTILRPLRKIINHFFGATDTAADIVNVAKQLDNVPVRPGQVNSQAFRDNFDQAFGNNQGAPSSGGTRLPQDVNVNPTPPRALPTNRPIGTSPTQNAAAQAEVRRLQAQGFTDIRVNQQQVNGAGQRVGINRPDITATSPQGLRVNIELDRSTSNRGPTHATRTRANDPDAEIILRTVD